MKGIAEGTYNSKHADFVGLLNLVWKDVVWLSDGENEP